MTSAAVACTTDRLNFLKYTSTRDQVACLRSKKAWHAFNLILGWAGLDQLSDAGVNLGKRLNSNNHCVSLEGYKILEYWVRSFS